MLLDTVFILEVDDRTIFLPILPTVLKNKLESALQVAGCLFILFEPHPFPFVLQDVYFSAYQYRVSGDQDVEQVCCTSCSTPHTTELVRRGLVQQWKTGSLVSNLSDHLSRQRYSQHQNDTPDC